MSELNTWSHILRADQFVKSDLDYVFKVTDAVRRLDKSKEGLLFLQSLLPHRRAMLYFTQPSTRTFLSFQSACHILGMKSSEIRDPSTSSERKGESIDDALRTFSSYVDLIIMRTPIAGLCDRFAKTLDHSQRPIPVINAGSGPDQHPTQALLDMYTLFRSFRNSGGIENKTVVMVGDLKRGRTVRSLASLLSLYDGVKLIFVSPREYGIADDLKQQLVARRCSFVETDSFTDAIAAGDAIYMTRIQDEYDTNGESKHTDFSSFYLRKIHLSLLKDHCVIMHPFPRRQEIDVEIDQDSRAKYWRQERNGMWVRVALITKLMQVDHLVVAPDL